MGNGEELKWDRLVAFCEGKRLPMAKMHDEAIIWVNTPMIEYFSCEETDMLGYSPLKFIHPSFHGFYEKTYKDDLSNPHFILSKTSYDKVIVAERISLWIMKERSVILKKIFEIHLN